MIFLSYLRIAVSMDYDFFSFYIYYAVGWQTLVSLDLHSSTRVLSSM